MKRQSHYIEGFQVHPPVLYKSGAMLNDEEFRQSLKASDYLRKVVNAHLRIYPEKRESINKELQTRLDHFDFVDELAKDLLVRIALPEGRITGLVEF
jgi:hypothetical protein